VKRELDEGRQAYVVAPLIEESESIEAAAATSLYEELCSTFLKDYKVGLLHGKMNKEEKKTSWMNLGKVRCRFLFLPL